MKSKGASLGRRIGLACVVWLLAGASFVSWGDSVAGPRFRDFSGTMYDGAGNEPLWNHSIGWIRREFLWANYEPVKGQYNEALLTEFAGKVTEYAAKGLKVLPLLDYNTTWSGEWGDVHGSLMAEHVVDWENYVRRVVTLLRGAPYNVEYFQIWNEAYPTSGFWNGNMDDYMERVHLPAAAIIRELGGKVVYGGWPCNAPIDEYISLLDGHHAWGSIDVLDVHYFGLDAWQRLYDAAVQRGYPDMGIWQTEVGFTSDPNFVSMYPQFLEWALAHQWNRPDRYKLFYYTFWAPDVPGAFGYNQGLYSGDHITPLGTAMQTLGNVIDGPGLRAYPQYAIEGMEGASCFAVDDRIVLTAYSPNGHAKATFPGIPWARVKSATQWGYEGTQADLMSTVQVASSGGVDVRFPSATSCMVVLSLYQGSEIFGSVPLGHSTFVGGTWTVEASLVHPAGTPTYQWLHNGVAIPGAPSTSTFTLPAIGIADEGFYSCAITDGSGTTFTTPPAYLDVLDPAALPATAPRAGVALGVLLAGLGVLWISRRPGALAPR